MSVVEKTITSEPQKTDVLSAGVAVPVGRWGRFRGWLNFTKPEYKVGTLTYTRAGLLLAFFWLLWGDLIWTLMETVYPASMPLQLDRLHVPKEWIGYMLGTAGATINVGLVPIISFRSDRTRTRWGRRIPYLIATLPLLCVFLAVLGYSDSIGAWINTSSLPERLHLSPMHTIILMMGVLILLYDVFNVFVNSIYWYLFRDVIPEAYLSRFMAAFRMMGTLASMIWGLFIYGKIETHTRQIYLGAAVLYFFGFGLMCLKVKEGEYPPPEDYVPGESGHAQRPDAGRSFIRTCLVHPGQMVSYVWRRFTALLARWREAIGIFFRECFTHPLFIAFYLSQTLFALGTACGMYKTFFYLRHMGFTTADMGKLTAIMSPIVLAVQFPMGWLADKIHPMRGSVIATTAVTPFIFAGYFLNDYTVAGYVVHAFTLYATISVLQMPFTQLHGASEIPLMMRLFPAQQYGQFSSANAMIRHFTMIFGSFAGATLMGYLNHKYGNAGNRYAFLWHGAFQTLGVICLWVVFYYWRKYGGDKFGTKEAEAVALS